MYMNARADDDIPIVCLCSIKQFSLVCLARNDLDHGYLRSTWNHRPSCSPSRARSLEERLTSGRVRIGTTRIALGQLSSRSLVTHPHALRFANKQWSNQCNRAC